MAAAVAPMPTRFVRRTMLHEHEYRVNFKQIDNEVIKALVAPEARKVTPQMSAIYLSLLAAPPPCWERDGVLHFTGEDRDGGHLTAWEQMRELTGVANSTLAKAVDWLHKAGVIGYDARANGVGIRIFFNRALASIRPKPQKNLALVPTPSAAAPTPSVGVGFKERSSERDLEDLSVRAGARENTSLDTTEQPTKPPVAEPPPCRPAPPAQPDANFVAALTKRITTELRPEIAAAVQRETEHTREWFLKYGLPKATRVAQRETYNLLRAHGVLAKEGNRSGDVGRYNPDRPDRPGGQAPEVAPEVADAAGREETGAAAGVGQGELERPAAFLAELSTELQKAAAQAPQTPLRQVCQNVSVEVALLRHELVTAGPSALGSIENKLLALEDSLAKALWETPDAAELDTLLKAARTALRDYEMRMERAVFVETVQKRVLAQLRERHRIPRLSLFYA